MPSNQYILPTNLKMPLILQSLEFYRTFTTTTMDTADYWPMAWEYSIWNATIASLQFWTEDLDPVTLGRATESVYTTFFYTSTSHTLCQQSDETLFGHFCHSPQCSFQPPTVGWRLESGSDTIDLPTPLWKDSSHSPCFQHGPHFIQPSSHHTSQYTTNTTQTIAQTLIF